jgi:Ku protein
MASRAVRSNVNLSLGLVNVQVAIRKMSDSAPKELSLSMGSPDGNAVSQRYLDETTGAIYTPSELPKGVWDDPKNKIGFHPVSTEAVQAIDAACELDGLVIEGFITADDFPTHRIEDTYFLAPEGGATHAKMLRLVRDTLAVEGVIGIGKCTVSKRQRPFAIFVEGEAVVLALLTFAAQCTAREQEAETALAGAPEIEASTITLARQLVTSMVGAADLDSYTDDSLPQREALIIAASQGQTIEVPAAAAPAAPVIDLEAALLASIGKQQDAAAPAKKPAAKKAKVAA